MVIKKKYYTQNSNWNISVKPGTAKFWIKVHDPGNIPRLGDEDLSNWIPIQTEQTGFLTNVDLKVHGEFSSSTQDFKDIRLVF